MRLRIALLAAAIALTSAACGMSWDKATERFDDAPRGATNDDAADIVTMPDGFSNLATKCDHGNRVYVAFKGDDNRAAVAVSVGDPSCAG